MRPFLLSSFAVLALIALHARAAEPPSAPDRPDLVTRFGRWALPTLEKRWPDHPEWVAMLADILGGSQLGPDDGWFRKAKAQTRFTAKATRAKLDKDGDGRIARKEFPGSDADFARLDRDGDGALTEPDFDWSPHALTASPGMMLFYRADRDGNGKVTRSEFEALFQSLDKDGLGFVSLDEMKEMFAPMLRRRGGSGGGGPSKGTLVRGLFRQEIGSLQPGPALDTFAPDFTLKTVEGDREVTLSKLIGPRPVVLIFGNFTCGPFRSQAGNVEKLFERYRDRAEFVMVYVREAHPTDGWSMESNEKVGVAIPQPRSQGERVKVARTCQSTLGFAMPFVVDTLEDTVGATYSGMPSRLYLIDGFGRVAYKSGRGPFGFKPGELEQALLLLLAEPSGR